MFELGVFSVSFGVEIRQTRFKYKNSRFRFVRFLNLRNSNPTKIFGLVLFDFHKYFFQKIKCNIHKHYTIKNS